MIAGFLVFTSTSASASASAFLCGFCLFVFFGVVAFAFRFFRASPLLLLCFGVFALSREDYYSSRLPLLVTRLLDYANLSS